MKTIRKYWSVVALGLAVTFGMAIRNFAPTSVEAAPTPTMVTVANTPLPVTPTVGSASATPLYVRNVDNSGHHPFAREVSCSPADQFKSCSVSFSVDSGKELVVETVSVEATVQTGNKTWGVISTSSGGVNLSSVQLPLQFQATFGGSADTYGGTQSLHLYADPATAVTLQGQEQPLGGATFVFDVSGYTVDCGSSGTTSNPCPVP